MALYSLQVESTQPSLPCVYITSPESRDGSFLEEQWSTGPPFMYTIPQFEILSVELKKIERGRWGNRDSTYSFVMILNCVITNYPAIVFVFLIQVSFILYSACMLRSTVYVCVCVRD